MTPPKTIYGPPPSYYKVRSKLVVFDLGGVLVPLNVQRCIDAFTELMGEKNMHQVLGIGGEGDDVEKLSVANRELMHQYEKGLITTEEFLTAVKQYCRADTTDDQIRKAWFSMVEPVPEQRLHFILRLRRKGYMTALLSNTNDMHWQYLSKKI